MTYFEALLYGAVQGITEYLPVSSSAHLILLPKFLGTDDPGLAFDVFLHIGTLAATLTYFWRDWWEILLRLSLKQGRGEAAAARLEARSSADALGRPSPAVDWKAIALATLPALAAGALFHHQAETIFRGTGVLAVTLALGGVLLFAVDRFFKRARPLDSLTPKDALAVGLAQCLALVPGMSRSGSTITAARALGFDRAAAARFSFLISAPVTAAAIAFELRKWRELVDSSVAAGPLLIALASSFLFGVIAIGGLMKMLKRFGYLSFAIYRVGMAVVIWRVLGV